MTIDPPRLLDDPSVSPALRGDLQHAAEVELQGLDLAAGLSQLRVATAGSTSASGSSLLAKLGLGAAVTGGAVALWLGLGGPSPDPGSPTAVAEATPTTVSGPALDEHAPALGAERGRSMAPAIEPQPTVVPEEALEHEAVAPSPEPAPEPGPDGLAAHPAASRPDEADARSERPDRDREAEPERRASAGDDDVLREARLVARARRALGRDPAASLALAEEAERDFPQGQLVEERRAIAIRALVALGRTDEAKRRADPFLATYGRGAHAAAVRRALASSPPL